MIEGFILAAGLGTRLRPLTDHCPKALVSIGGETLLGLAIQRLAAAGVEHIVVNVHHLGDMVIDYLQRHPWPCRIDIADERQRLLDTGGGMKHAAPLFEGKSPIVVHNVDVLSDIDLAAVVAQHHDEGNLATLCVSRRPTQRPLAFREGVLVGRAESGEATVAPCEAMAFSGISVIDPKLFGLLPPADHPYPIIDQYIALSRQWRIGSYVHAPGRWLDVGKPETLEQAAQWRHS